LCVLRSCPEKRAFLRAFLGCVSAIAHRPWARVSCQSVSCSQGPFAFGSYSWPR